MNTSTENKTSNGIIVKGIISNLDYISYYNYYTQKQNDNELPEFVTDYFQSETKIYMKKYKDDENKREKFFSWNQPYDIDYSPKNQFYQNTKYYHYK